MSEKITGRKLKGRVLDLLSADDPIESLRQLSLLPAREVMNPLFSFLYNENELVRWRAVTVMGQIMRNLAERDMESAREFMRRLMWSLNEESGGIGWGAPEAMGEIMACQEKLAAEYAPIFVSYLDARGNFIEYEMLQRGLIWGLIRLTESRPELAIRAAAHIGRYLESGDATVRGLAAWAAGLLQAHETRSRLEALIADKSELRLYSDGKMVTLKVRDLAEKGLALLNRC
jgi:HEAT repeat protein